MKSRVLPLVKTVLFLIALLAALLLKGAVMVLPNANGTQSTQCFSYLSKVPFAYGNFAPMFTAITIMIGLLLAVLSVWLCGSRDLSTAVCFAGVIGFVLSLGSILFGKEYYPVGAFLVSFLLFMQLPIYLVERLSQRRQ